MEVDTFNDRRFSRQAMQENGRERGKMVGLNCLITMHEARQVRQMSSRHG